MPYPLKQALAVVAGVAVAVALILAVGRPAPVRAQTTGPVYDLAWGANVTITAAPGRAVTRELLTSCPPGMYPLAGGYNVDALTGVGARVEVLGDYAAQLPYGDEPGMRAVKVRVTSGTASVTPYRTCATGEQLPG